MNILAIETSCDETALSVIHTETFDTENPNFAVLSDLIISQIEIHAKYGGVFPAMAKREHAKNLSPLLKQSLQQSGLYQESMSTIEKIDYVKEILEREPELFTELTELLSTIKKPNIDMIMVTYGPGLAPALWVGVNFARALSVLWNIPIIPVNHMEGHITSILLKKNYLNEQNALLDIHLFSFPYLALLISGGHTQLVCVKDWGDYKIIGESIDDAVGEAFDKVGRMLGFSYPGGPKVSKAAMQGKENNRVNLPRPMVHTKDYRFSFSGLKTAVRYLIKDLEEEELLDEQMIADIAYEFENAVTDVLVKKTMAAMEEYSAQGLIIAGGVSANNFITEAFKRELHEYGAELYLPEKKLCGDNSLMIATAGFIQYWKHKKITHHSKLSALGNLRL
jgi:N6-L-threonylcarbamoyladenine synthase